MSREPAPSAAGTDIGVTASLLVLGHQTARLLEERLDVGGLGAGEAVLLQALTRGPLTMTGVTRTLHIKPSTATSLVNRLEALGLVHRAQNPSDRRSLLVDLTGEGERRAGETLPAFRELDAALRRSAPQLTLDQVRHAIDQLAGEP